MYSSLSSSEWRGKEPGWRIRVGLGRVSVLVVGGSIGGVGEKVGLSRVNVLVVGYG